jgi:hypothetical protein
MVLKSLLFVLVGYVITLVIALFVAFIIQIIALIVQRGGKGAAKKGAAANSAPKQS